jgi:hypothetical protein
MSCRFQLLASEATTLFALAVASSDCAALGFGVGIVRLFTRSDTGVCYSVAIISGGPLGATSPLW